MDSSISVEEGELIVSFEEGLGFAVFVGDGADGSVDEDEVFLEVEVDEDWFHVEFSCVVE